MTMTPEYVEQRVWELYDDVHARRFFQDQAIDPGARTYTVHRVSDTIEPQAMAADDEMPMQTMDFDEMEIPIERQFSEMTPEMYEHHDDPWEIFDEQWVSSFTRPIHATITDEVGTEPLRVDSYNEVPFEAFYEGRMVVMEQYHSDPMSMLVSDRLAEDILDDSVFDEWDVIERDLNEEFGIDVFRDRYHALSGNEILFADRSEFGYEFHAREPYVEERGLSIRAGARTGYAVTNPDAAIRLQVAV